MSLELTVSHSTPYRGLRQVDSHKDLAQVADLIEQAFSGELEPDGLAALRDLRWLARAGPLVHLAARSDPYLEDVLMGFVWIEDERVVGNVTLQRLDSQALRWQIANVAVDKAYRRRGIGRSLMLAALERLAERQATWALLQVRTDNAAAQDLYRSLGFELTSADRILRLARLPSPRPQAAAPAGLRPYHHSEWQQRFQLESASRSELTRWWRPIRSHDFMQLFEHRAAESFWRVLGRNRVQRWVIPGVHGFAAWLALDAWRWPGMHRVAITVHPTCRGQWERALVDFALASLTDYPALPVQTEVLGEHPELLAALQAAGFDMPRNLLVMRRKIDASPAE